MFVKVRQVGQVRLISLSVSDLRSRKFLSGVSQSKNNFLKELLA